MKKNILNKLNKLDVHTLEVVKKSAGSMLVKVTGMCCAVAVSIFLGHTLGADGLGVINLSSKIVSILLTFGLFGFSHVIIKEIAIALDTKAYSYVSNVMHTAYWFNCILSLTIAVIFILIAPWLANTVFDEPRLTYPLILGLVIMTPQVLSRIFSSGLIGYRKIWQSNLVDQALSIVITGVILLGLYFSKTEVTINRVAIAYAIGSLVVTISVGLYWRSIHKSQGDRTLVTKKLLKVGTPLFVASLTVLVINSLDIIILGWFTDTKQIGIYTVASRVALLTSFVLQILNSTLSPKIAALYASEKKEELNKLIQGVTKGLMFFGIVILLIFVVFGKWILGIWGEEFKVGYTILIILGVGQFVNLATGSVGIILIMTGFEKIQAKISIIAMIVFVVLNFVLVPLYGALGAAIASVITISGINFAKFYFVQKVTGVKLYNYK
ncbi:flippase [Winogradskyella helgolandensis]|uniref:flippase n=1 Tax=Winogradskyella helgolandensis TaxID=2697010 RepID=UPI0015C731ED|nr:flippase [Winogradskyella helgolandensis]